MPVQISVCESVHAPARDVFNAAAAIEARDLIRKFGPLPGVVETNGHNAPWSAIGDVRLHTLTDNSSVREELVAFTAGQTFAYRLTEFTGPFASLIKHARADWHFTQAGQSKTKIDWTYSFTPTSALAEPIVWFIVKLFWPGYLKAALTRVKQKAESGQA